MSKINIDKAIELNNESEKSLRDHKFIDHADAIKLGIEALKDYQKLKLTTFLPIGYKLPGETPIRVINPSKDEIKKLRESPIGEK